MKASLLEPRTPQIQYFRNEAARAIMYARRETKADVDLDMKWWARGFMTGLMSALRRTAPGIDTLRQLHRIDEYIHKRRFMEMIRK